jgi:DNA-binding LytR/AlgR family response regulator
MSIKVLIVEDEFIIAEHIRKALEEYGYSANHAFSSKEAEELLETDTPDIVLLDINLSRGDDGVKVAELINERYHLPFIFLTSFSDGGTLNRVKKVRPAAYLTKPFKKDDLFAAIEIALSNFADEEDSEESVFGQLNSPAELRENLSLAIGDAIFVKYNKMLTKLPFAEITYFKSDRVYLEIYRKDKPKMVIRDTLNSIELKLGERFLRIHRSYLINLDHLDSIGTADVMVDEMELPIGKQQRDELINRIRS